MMDPSRQMCHCVRYVHIETLDQPDVMYKEWMLMSIAQDVWAHDSNV